MSDFAGPVRSGTSIAFAPDGKLYVTELKTILGQPSDVLFQADPVTGNEISGAQLSDFAGPVRSGTSIAFTPAGGLYVTELKTILGQPSDVVFQADPVTGNEISGAQLADFAGPVRGETSITFAPDLATTAVSEPSSVALIVAFLAGFGVVRFRAHRRGARLRGHLGEACAAPPSEKRS